MFGGSAFEKSANDKTGSKGEENRFQGIGSNVFLCLFLEVVSSMFCFFQNCLCLHFQVSRSCVCRVFQFFRVVACGRVEQKSRFGRKISWWSLGARWVRDYLARKVILAFVRS